MKRLITGLILVFVLLGVIACGTPQAAPTPTASPKLISIQIPQDQYVRVGDINTRFWKSGDEGTAVILIHGLGGSVENWVLNVEALAQNHCVYAIDLAGFGRSDRPSVLFTPSYGAQFVSDFMETQNIERASLIGNSLGGAVALRFAIQFPDKLEKLVLVDSAGLGQEMNFVMRLVTLPLIGELLTRPSREGIARMMKEMVYDPALITDESVEQFYQMASLPGWQKYYLSTLRGMGNILGPRTEIVKSILDNLASITAPTLIIWGQQDRILPVADAYVAHEKIPNTELKIFDCCGHVPQFEHPDEFNTLVLEFLAR
jgi:pimeloyl-ACP methyl ester carboxylesterase